MPRVLTERAKDFLDMMPPFVQGDPNIQAAVQVMSNECDRIDQNSADVVASYFPQLASRFLYLWEASLGLAPNLPTLSVTQRQMRVLAFIAAQLDPVPGSQWVGAVNLLLGPTWTWERHTPGSGSPPLPDNIQIDLPYPVGSGRATDLIALLRIITPANIELVINYAGGFIVQGSQIQSQPL